ncbi:MULTISPECIES: TrlF family AAA-like ATPase [unclassified Janthinobacterium]|uniref:TrlF family AAA-like ATPase n=1 Tax=unclassified Janthinobacterium TaxID=2610881 RepID=UPI00088546E3|nr:MULTISPECIES: AAA family ATPase [unclassified Janthinobacterium]SDA60777.1 AAA domain [Janthinobacterium sp. 551a]SFB35011.1 AAA domain [Janthinobacterium sp. 344]
MANDPAGSTWKKWDLHVHTPASVVHNYPGSQEEAWEAFLLDLEALPPEFKVVGINDYIFIDGYERVRKAKLEDGRLKNIDLILPVIELRLDKFAGVVKKEKDGSYSQSGWNRINLHVIFDALDPELIRQQFLGSLAPSYDLIPDSSDWKGKWQSVITRDSLAELGAMILESAPADKRAAYAPPLHEGFNNLCVSLEKVMEALNKHALAGRYLIAVGKTEWDNLKWDDQSIAEKRNIINRADLVFTASENPAKYDSARKKLIESNVKNALLDCSDAHALSNSPDKDRVGNCFTWIKADATFEGLQQALTEFEDRVYVGDMPPKRLLVEANRTKYISSIRVSQKPGSTIAQTWFDVDMPLSHDLVAIIGNKGSGKSALADIAALAGDTKNFKGFSFLNEKRFRNGRNKLASHFNGALGWMDGTHSERALDQDPSDTSVERVKYLPQSYLETLCNELGDGGSSTFDTELRKIIYTHVPEDARLGYNSMDELLNFKVAEIEAERALVIKEMSKTNAEILQAEKRLSPDFKQSLQQQLDMKIAELTALDSARPAQVEDPTASDAAKEASHAATERIEALEAELKKMREEERLLRDKKATQAKRQAVLIRVTQAISNHRKAHDQFVSELAVMLADVDGNLKASDLVDLKIDTKKIEELSKTLKDSISSVDAALSSQEPTGINKRREIAEAGVTEIKGKLGEKQRLFIIYKEQVTKWELAKQELLGNKDKVQSIEWFKDEIATLEFLPAKLVDLKATRVELAKRVHDQIVKTVEEYRRLYEPVRAFVKSAAQMDMHLPLDFDVRIEESNFQDQFFAKISRQSRGSFYGKDESNQLMRALLTETDFDDVDSTLKFLDMVDDRLHFDRRDSAAGREAKLSDQLRSGIEPQEVLDYIFGMGYLVPRYSLTFDNQEISQLSPGERGLLLLVFYLLVDKDDIPIIVDQPEENLDNQTIFKVLVKCIKAAKKRRQVIMVTHNPNLAVVCDAEQIISATCDKASNRFTYISGGIESPAIKARVVEILEGTEPAFKNRKQKYGL